MSIRKKGLLRIVVCLIAAVLLLAGNSDAAMFTVTTNADSGPGSLLQAILDANATVDLDEIQVDAGVGVITLASEVNISSPLMIRGGGADTFLNDLHKDLKADYIMANPPFNLDS